MKGLAQEQVFVRQRKELNNIMLMKFVNITFLCHIKMERLKTENRVIVGNTSLETGVDFCISV